MTTKAKLYIWNTIEGEEVRPGVSRKGFRGDQFMMVMNTLEPGMEINPHSHPFEQAVYIVQGKVRFHIGDEIFEGGPKSDGGNRDPRTLIDLSIREIAARAMIGRFTTQRV